MAKNFSLVSMISYTALYMKITTIVVVIISDNSCNYGNRDDNTVRGSGLLIGITTGIVVI